jgi:hypothetical protein
MAVMAYAFRGFGSKEVETSGDWQQRIEDDACLENKKRIKFLWQCIIMTQARKAASLAESFCK